MKCTTVTIVAVLLYVLLILPDAYGNRGHVGHPGQLRPQQAIGVPPLRPHRAVNVPPGPLMRPQRAVLHGHFRQPGPRQQEGRTADGRPRYARGDHPDFAATGAVIANGATNAAESLVLREAEAVNIAAGGATTLATGAIAGQATAGLKLVHAVGNSARLATDTVAATASTANGHRRRRNN